MQLTLHFFARLRRELGQDTLQVSVDNGLSVRQLAQQLMAQHGLQLKGCMVAVNDEYAEPDQVLQSGDEVAFLPPVAGGSGIPSDGDIPADYFALTTQPLRLEDAATHLSAAAHGANAFFSGTVRSPNDGQQVSAIDYEGYEALALNVMASCAAQVRQKFGPLSVYTVHRLGRVVPGESSLIIGVSSAHRRAALDACSELLELLKAELPVWKYEHDCSGEHWVAGTAAHKTL